MANKKNKTEEVVEEKSYQQIQHEIQLERDQEWLLKKIEQEEAEVARAAAREAALEAYLDTQRKLVVPQNWSTDLKSVADNPVAPPAPAPEVDAPEEDADVGTPEDAPEDGEPEDGEPEDSGEESGEESAES